MKSHQITRTATSQGPYAHTEHGSTVASQQFVRTHVYRHAALMGMNNTVRPHGDNAGSKKSRVLAFARCAHAACHRIERIKSFKSICGSRSDSFISIADSFLWQRTQRASISVTAMRISMCRLQTRAYRHQWSTNEWNIMHGAIHRSNQEGRNAHFRMQQVFGARSSKEKA